MALLQNPRQQRMLVAPDDSGGDLPAIPGTARPDQQPQAFQGARQVGAFLARQTDPLAARAPAPVTASTPQSMLQRKWDNAAFGFRPDTSVDGNGNASWATQPFGTPGVRTSNRMNPAGLLRPAAGPGSADWNALAQDPSTGRVAVNDIPVAATLIRPDGTSTAIAPAARAGAAPARGSLSEAASPVLQPPTAATTPEATSGVTVGGRQVPFGAMVNGVPTFSDGSGLGGNPRTMSDKQIGALGDQLNTVNGANFSRALAQSADGSTPTQDQMVARLVRNTPVPITGSRPTAADFAASDAQAIASRDWRSAAGTAASNLAVEAAYARTPRLRRIAETQLQQLQGAAAQSGQLAQQADNQQALTAQQGSNELARTALAGQYGVAEQQAAQLRRPRQQVTLGDGTIGLLDQTNGTVTPATMADGTVARGPVTREDAGTKRTQELIDQLNKGVQEQLKNYVPTANAPEPTPDMIRGWRAQQALALNLPVATNPKTGERVVNINGQWTQL